MSAAVRNKRLPEDMSILRGASRHETMAPLDSWHSWTVNELERVRREREARGERL